MSKVSPSEKPWPGGWVAGIEFRHLISRPRLFAGGFAEPAAHLSLGTCQRAQLVCLLCSETQGCVLQQMGPVSSGMGGWKEQKVWRVFGIAQPWAEESQADLQASPHRRSICQCPGCYISLQVGEDRLGPLFLLLLFWFGWRTHQWRKSSFSYSTLLEFFHPTSFCTAWLKEGREWRNPPQEEPYPVLRLFWPWV